MATETPHSRTSPGAVQGVYLGRELAVRQSAEEARTYAEMILRDLDEGRVPSVRGVIDAALKLSKDIEVMSALAALPAEQD